MKKAKTESRYLIETTIQIDKYKRGSKAQDFISTTKDLYSSNFVLFEFKTGFIKSLIDYYMLVEITNDPVVAMSQWSDDFSKRNLGNVHLLNSITGTIFGSIDTSSTVKTLRQIETSIHWLITNFDTDLVGMVGDFGSDKIVKFSLDTRRDYYPFMKIIKDTRGLIELESFWEKHTSELLTLLKNKSPYKTPALKKIYGKLEKIDKDLTKANQFMINKGIGDAVIAVDTLGSMILATTDHSFDAMMPILGKKHLIVR